MPWPTQGFEVPFNFLIRTTDIDTHTHTYRNTVILRQFCSFAEHCKLADAWGYNSKLQITQSANAVERWLTSWGCRIARPTRPQRHTRLPYAYLCRVRCRRPQVLHTLAIYILERESEWEWELALYESTMTYIHIYIYTYKFTCLRANVFVGLLANANGACYTSVQRLHMIIYECVYTCMYTVKSLEFSWNFAVSVLMANTFKI